MKINSNLFNAINQSEKYLEFWKYSKVGFTYFNDTKGSWDSGKWHIQKIENNEVNINTPCHFAKDTLLHRVVRNGDYKTAEYLLKKGANVNLQNKLGWTPLHFAVFYPRDPDEPYNLAHPVAFLGGPLMKAGHDAKMVKLLLDYGADVNVKNVSGHTPLHFCGRHSSTEIVKTLISHGADVNATDATGSSPIFLFVYLNQETIGIVGKYLLAHGADMFQQNYAGDFPFRHVWSVVDEIWCSTYNNPYCKDCYKQNFTDFIQFMNIAQLKEVKLLIQKHIQINKFYFVYEPNMSQSRKVHYTKSEKKHIEFIERCKILEKEVDSAIENILQWYPNVIDSFLIFFAHNGTLEIDETEIITSLIENLCPINKLSVYKANFFDFSKPDSASNCEGNEFKALDNPIVPKYDPENYYLGPKNAISKILVATLPSQQSPILPTPAPKPPEVTFFSRIYEFILRQYFEFTHTLKNIIRYFKLKFGLNVY